MRFIYPGSFLKLLLLGFGLVALPLALALVDAYLSLERLTRQSEHAVVRAMQITRDSRTLGEQVTALERMARQYLILNNPEGLEAYASRRQQFLGSVQSFSQEINDNSTLETLQALSQQESQAWAVLNQETSAPDKEQNIINNFDTMANTSTMLIQRADDRIETEVSALKQQATQERRTVLQKLWALIPIGLFLSIAVTLLIRMPIRQIGIGIRNMGEGKLDQPIEVRGPHDLEMLGNQLNWLRQRLQQADAQQTQFLHHISHEFKTPLTALHEGTQLLNDAVAGPLNTEQKEIVRIVRDNVTRLRKLIEDLLDYSSMRFQPMSVQLEHIPLAALFERVEQDQRLALAARDLSLLTQHKELTIVADREKLRVILDNLVSNAIKYAPEHSVIELRAQLQLQHHTHTAIIEVTDSGPGIDPIQAKKIFEPFVQGPPADNLPIKGSGLGLSIVKELVSAHGGEVLLLPNEPHGTCARLYLPQQTPIRTTDQTPV